MLLPFGAKAQSQMRVKLLSGDDVVCKLSESPKVAFADKVLTLTVGEKDTQLEIANVQKFIFEPEGTSSINQVSNGAQTVAFNFIDGKTIAVSHANASTLRLVDMSGRVVAEQAVKDGAATVSLSALVKGVYVLTVGNQSVKVTIK